MKITDEDFKEILACFDPKNVPDNLTEARQVIENFVDLVEILMRPLPLPPAGRSSFMQRPSDHREASFQSLSPTGSTQEVPGRNSGIGFERR